MKRVVLFRVVGIGLVLLVVGVFVPIRSQDIITSGAQALWNKDELYIFVEQNKMVWSQNLWSFSWGFIKRSLTAATPPTFRRIDSTVYRVTSTTLEEDLAKGWHVVWAIAPFKGVPHAFMGVDHNWGVYRWLGNGFEQLSSSEALAAKSGYASMDDLFTREGWTQLHVLPVRGTADYKLTLANVEYVIRATQLKTDQVRSS
jgi:hypothetical protein